MTELLKKCSSSLQLKLFLSLTLIVALGMVAVLASQIYLVQDYFIRQAEANLRNSNYLLSRVLAEPVFDNDQSMLQARVQEIQIKLRLCNLQLKDHYGNVVYKVGKTQTRFDSEFNPNSLDGCYNTIIPVVRGNDLIGTARMGVRTDDIAEARNDLIRQSAFFSVFWFALLMLPFFLQIRRMIRPLDELSKAAHEISKGNLDYPIPHPVPGDDELARLTSNFKDITTAYVRDHVAKREESAALEEVARMRNKLDQEMLLRKAADENHRLSLRLLQQTEHAFGRLIPQQLLSLMGKENIIEVKLGDQFERKLTVMCSDIRNFTTLSESMTPQNNFDFLNSYLEHMEPIITSHKGIIDKFIGDSILAIFTDGADNAVSGAIKMLEELEEYNACRARSGYVPIQIGFGLNTGMVMVGTVGSSTRMDSTVIGDAVNMTYRIEDATKTYFTPLLISQNTLYDLTQPDKYDLRFLDRIRVKGKKQPISIFEVFNNDPEKLREGKRATKEKFEKAIAYYHLRQIPSAMELLKQCIKENPKDIPARIYLTRCEQYLATGQHFSTGELNNQMEWRKEYQVNIDAVDMAHRHLFSRVNEFISASIAGDREKINILLGYLESHLIESKEEEEYLMSGTEYPFIKHHQREHRRFINDFTVLKEDADKGLIELPYLMFRIQLLMFDWFSGHITNSDRHASRHILNTMAQESNGLGTQKLAAYLASSEPDSNPDLH